MTKNFTHLRIIAGIFRGRKLKFEALPHVRPTTNRTRETLFNWLTPKIVGARCLDCFTGTGALGFEALSRGASHVTMIDQSVKVIKNLQENAKTFGAQNIDFYCTKFPPKNIHLGTFDIVFIDPPFRQNLVEKSIAFLIKENLLNQGALIYIEAEKSLKNLSLPLNAMVIQSKAAGQVGYHLVSLQ